MMTDGSCTTNATTTFDVMERLPSPVGLTSNENGQLEITFSGGVKGAFSGLTPGKYYFTNTKGNLVADEDFAGRSGQCSGSTSAKCTGYLYDEASQTIVTLGDSRVGIAIAEDTIVVALNS